MDRGRRARRHRHASRHREQVHPHGRGARHDLDVAIVPAGRVRFVLGDRLEEEVVGDPAAHRGRGHGVVEAQRVLWQVRLGLEPGLASHHVSPGGGAQHDRRLLKSLPLLVEPVLHELLLESDGTAASSGLAAACFRSVADAAGGCREVGEVLWDADPLRDGGSQAATSGITSGRGGAAPLLRRLLLLGIVRGSTSTPATAVAPSRTSTGPKLELQRLVLLLDVVQLDVPMGLALVVEPLLEGHESLLSDEAVGGSPAFPETDRRSHQVPLAGGIGNGEEVALLLLSLLLLLLLLHDLLIVLLLLD